MYVKELVRLIQILLNTVAKRTYSIVGQSAHPWDKSIFFTILFTLYFGRYNY